jgi:hypothetical protein
MDRTLEIVKQKINEKQAQLSYAISNGAAKDFAEYRAMCGEVRGLSLAEGYLLDLANQMERNDDE